PQRRLGVCDAAGRRRKVSVARRRLDVASGGRRVAAPVVVVDLAREHDVAEHVRDEAAEIAPAVIVRRVRGGDGAGGRELIEAFVEPRSEEHTSELQSPYDLVCRLLLEK